MALSLALHAALLILLVVSFHPPGPSNGTALSVVPVTLVSAESLPSTPVPPEPYNDETEVTDNQMPTTAASATPHDGGETVLMLQTLTGMPDRLSKLHAAKKRALRESKLGSAVILPVQSDSANLPSMVLANALPDNTNNTHLVVANQTTQEAGGMTGIVITIRIGQAQAKTTLHPTFADAQLASDTTVSVLQ